MRIVVTGGSGFVGQGLVPYLAEQLHRGIVTGRTAPRQLPPGWVGWQREDVLATPLGSVGIDGIVHLEVKQHVLQPKDEDLAEFQRVNVDGTREWTEWAVLHGVTRFVYVSSIKAVGIGNGPQRESAQHAPDTPYGKSKAAAEAVVRAWADAAPDRVATILRPAPVYGPGNEANLAAFVRQIARRRPCFVGDGNTQKSIVGRRNLVAAIHFALERDQPGCEVFNVSDSETLTVRELADMIAEIGNWPRPRGVPAMVANVMAPCGDIFERLTGRAFPLTTARLRALVEETVFPCDKLVAAGFRHPADVRTGLEEMISWAMSSGGLAPQPSGDARTHP